MTSAISPDNERFIEQEINNGTYQDRNEALNAGISFLREHRQLISRLAESRRQLDVGDYTEFDGPSLREFFEDLQLRARVKAEVSDE